MGLGIGDLDLGLTINLIVINSPLESHWSFVSTSNKLTFVSNYYMSRRDGGWWYLYYIGECNFVMPSQLVSKKVDQKTLK